MLLLLDNSISKDDKLSYINLIIKTLQKYISYKKLKLYLLIITTYRDGYCS